MINHKNYKRLRIFGMKKSLKYIIVLMLFIVMGGIGYMFYPEQQAVQKQEETPQTESLEKVFYERLDKTGDPVKAINKMIEEYGEGALDVLAKAWDIPGLSKEDFNFGRNYIAEYEEQEKKYKENSYIYRPASSVYDSAVRGSKVIEHLEAEGRKVDPIYKKQELSLKKMMEN